MAGGVFKGEYGAVSAGELGFPEPGCLIRKGGAKRVKLSDGDPGNDFFLTRLLLRPPRAILGEDDQSAAVPVGERGIT
jgi:hypothetical protein